MRAGRISTSWTSSIAPATAKIAPRQVARRRTIIFAFGSLRVILSVLLVVVGVVGPVAGQRVELHVIDDQARDLLPWLIERGDRARDDFARRLPPLHYE